jgi:hypothetical protein
MNEVVTHVISRPLGVFPRWLGWLFGWLFRAAPSFAGELKNIAAMRATAGQLHFSRRVDMRGGDGVSAEAEALFIFITYGRYSARPPVRRATLRGVQIFL